MLVTIFSDSHDHQENVKKIIEISKEKKSDYIIHAGDLISPFTVKIINESGIPYFYIFGNNDGEVLFLKTMLKKGKSTFFRQAGKFEIDGLKFALMHEPYWLDEVVTSGIHDVVVYGHTHEVDIRKVSSSIVINPGESCGYLTGKSTFVLFNTETKNTELIDI